MKKYTVCLLCFCCALSFSHEQQEEVFLKTAASADSTAQVRLTVGHVGNSYFCRYWRWGAEGVCPDAAVRQIELRVDGSDIYVPLSSVSGLGNPRKIFLRTESQGFLLEIKGGDASVAYTARIHFDKKTVTKRVVYAGGFPNSAREVVTYTFPSSDCC